MNFKIEKKELEILEQVKNSASNVANIFTSKKIGDYIQTIKSCNRMELQKLSSYCLDIVHLIDCAGNKEDLEKRAKNLVVNQQNSEKNDSFKMEVAEQSINYSHEIKELDDSVEKLLSSFIDLDADSILCAKDIIISMFRHLFTKTLSKTCEDSETDLNVIIATCSEPELSDNDEKE